ncbi:CusA/CzcA family heavy metal efflux RND transporter [Arenibacter sp. GZD96]|uniref:CusA/CzcA family heavy metal efflux RND transporter n=1 Tax=Aurantibrevibacter litoralis TaxID=3106030 RepID=UPI002AFE6026|nr:CusA/CzcA family heavy metal efflux RND transporter [Arenibacter sp. GZD-96]MEA1785742.1 CusA/CzcA family heavy metal efflux RND transporter [Arenibacter sp. GZD-96]
MLERIIQYSIHHKLIILLFTAIVIGFGVYSLSHIPIGAVPDVTNNQVQVITTSRNLATEDVEKFLTYPVELEMANLPGVEEIRSISKFGLSVVTVVFEDKIGTYLPRQLIAEKIKSAEERIPVGFGTPFMGPVSTGLGEIYQYVIDVDAKHKDTYSLSDIRTIQDWIVKRQLSGIPGVVEVNTWGGHLKTYEVAVNPERLRAVNVSILDVFTALEKNNSIAGGSYIEKGNESFFIRGEGLVSSLSDIENIVVANRDGIPLLIRDIAKVGFGRANRFGAITGNGEGEKVLGQVMMLKGANSNSVIEAVKQRVAEIQSTLPTGISINPILERSELISKTTFTIAENLILGCLIVIFVVVLLLGNWRSGLVVASVIPLCMLFALSLMYVFDVDANLMSLGAIDFGIIIDGAVIIVEFIAFKITSQRTTLLALPVHERQGLIDRITYQGTTKMMNSAVFGQLIIIIVFIPILSLVGVEGKMFRPMAMVFCFALLGAMIFCFTYIPVMASLFIKPANTDRKTISSQLIGFLQNKYVPIITWAMRRKKLVLGLAILVLIFSGLLFSRMGGEFVPTLDEGDFVIQPVLKTGTSLSKTVAATTQMERILLTFPEVAQVVTRIGAAEVPTDPMSMEESDVIIKLKPKNEWVSAESKDELADKFKKALTDEIAGVDFEFTQPIEMRFNELITGVRADLAIKIFGEDLEILHRKAVEIEKAIKDVEGAADIIVEKTEGLPQMSVTYDRQKIAKYGMNIEDLNKVVTMGFAGMSAGTVFEGEKQFNLVVRYDEAHRKDIGNLERTAVMLPNGNTLPLSEFAQINYTTGPAKISRDDTKRRIVVGVNVRNRDLESVVNDVQRIIERDIKFPAGYTVSYGGQFENLRAASKRLTIAVPIALVLIFVLLYFAFNSVKEALLIYSAIPLAAIGGVLLLYVRGLPFSISAGVGFIALFGIAVLNGIVLIEEFKELKAHGITNINKRILMGTRNRLRPVLLTAAAAALGFLPMAISTSAGAEVQRPLATVVVGGLITATILTLVVLPILYSMFDRKDHIPKRKLKVNLKALPLLVLLVLPVMGSAQSREISAQEALEIALEHNKGLRAAAQMVDQSKQLVGSAFNLDKTQIYYNYDENNIAPNGLALRVFGISQSLQFPTVYGAQRRLEKQKVNLASQQYRLSERLLTKEVNLAYYNAVYQNNLVAQYAYLDSLYGQFANASEKRYRVGETNLLEKLTAQAKHKEIAVQLAQSRENEKKALALLQQWLQSDSLYAISGRKMPKLVLLDWNATEHPGAQYLEAAQDLSESALRLERQKLLPDLQIAAFQGTNSGADVRQYAGFQVGVAVPLWFGAHKAKINAAKTETLIAENQLENYKIQLEASHQGLLSDLKTFEEALTYYETTGKTLADQLTTNASKAFVNGELDFLQYVQLLESAKTIEINYLQNLFQYNRTVLELNYLTN